MKQVSADSIIGKQVTYLDYLGDKTSGTIVSFVPDQELEPGEVYVYIKNDDYEDLNTNVIDTPTGPMLDKLGNIVVFDMLKRSTEISILE